MVYLLTWMKQLWDFDRNGFWFVAILFSIFTVLWFASIVLVLDGVLAITMLVVEALYAV